MNPAPTRGVRRALALSAVMLCVSAAGAQQTPQATFRSGVELVQIDVVVTDASGRHVRGLTARDFVLQDRGKPQAVAAFEEVTHTRPSTPGTAAAAPDSVRLDIGSNQTAQAGRLIVIVIDDLHIWRGRTDTAKAIARGVLTKLGREASMAVLFTSGDNSTQVTEDRALLASAIDTLQGRQSVRRPNQVVDSQKPGGIDPEAPSDVALAIVAKTQSTSVQQFADNMSMITTLRDAARIMGAGDLRRKAFVFISEGIAKNPTGIFGSMKEPGEVPQGGAAYVEGNLAALNTVGPPPYHDIELIKMMEAMRRANVTTYAIDPRGEVTSQELALELHPEPVALDEIFRWNNPLRKAQDGLSTISMASGGFAVTNTDNFLGGVEAIVDDLDHYYLLGFYPADMRGNGFRQVQVSVPGHPEWKLRFRRGYVPAETHTHDKPVNPLVALSTGVLPAADLALRLGAVVLPGDGKDAMVSLGLEVSAARAAMQEADGHLRDELSYQVLVVDEKKKNVKSATGLSARVNLSPNAPAGQLPAIATYQVSDRISLPPGRYQLRVAARSRKLAAGGSVYLHVDVPDFRKEALALSGIALGYSEGARIASTTAIPSARSAPARAAARMPMAPPPPLLPFTETLDRAFTARDVLRIYFEVSGNPAGANGRLAILNAADESGRGFLTFSPDAQGRVHLQLPLSTLTPGGYILRATLENAAGAATTRDIGIVIK